MPSFFADSADRTVYAVTFHLDERCNVHHVGVSHWDALGDVDTIVSVPIGPFDTLSDALDHIRRRLSGTVGQQLHIFE